MSKTSEDKEDSREEFQVGDRVLYKAELNNPGHYAPGAMLPGTVEAAFPNPIRPSYRIKLDMVWRSDRVPAGGEHIVVGNVRSNVIFREKLFPLEDLKPEIPRVRLVLVSR